MPVELWDRDSAFAGEAGILIDFDACDRKLEGELIDLVAEFLREKASGRWVVSADGETRAWSWMYDDG